jgi:hypothetical protein
MSFDMPVTENEKAALLEAEADEYCRLLDAQSVIKAKGEIHTFEDVNDLNTIADNDFEQAVAVEAASHFEHQKMISSRHEEHCRLHRYPPPKPGVSVFPSKSEFC